VLHPRTIERALAGKKTPQQEVAPAQRKPKPGRQ